MSSLHFTIAWWFVCNKFWSNAGWFFCKRQNSVTASRNKFTFFTFFFEECPAYNFLFVEKPKAKLFFSRNISFPKKPSPLSGHQMDDPLLSYSFLGRWMQTSHYSKTCEVYLWQFLKTGFSSKCRTLYKWLVNMSHGKMTIETLLFQWTKYRLELTKAVGFRGCTIFLAKFTAVNHGIWQRKSVVILVCCQLWWSWLYYMLMHQTVKPQSSTVWYFYSSQRQHEAIA